MKTTLHSYIVLATFSLFLMVGSCQAAKPAPKTSSCWTSCLACCGKAVDDAEVVLHYDLGNGITIDSIAGNMITTVLTNLLAKNQPVLSELMAVCSGKATALSTAAFAFLKTVGLANLTVTTSSGPTTLINSDGTIAPAVKTMLLSLLTQNSVGKVVVQGIQDIGTVVAVLPKGSASPTPSLGVSGGGETKTPTPAPVKL